MKKLLLLMMALSLGMRVNAQCPLNTAVDFTATDCHGTEIHLFDILDGGQYVLIDFFYYSCSACNQTAPFMVQSYTAMGCNMHDVFYMEISDRDSDALCQAWTANYGVEYPTISGAAGGAAINDQYGISAYPTVILIAPDHSIVINDLWPISSAQTVITALEQHGVQQHDCTEPTGELTITPDTLWYSHMGEDQTFTILNETDDVVTIEDVIPEAGSAMEIWQPSFPLTLESGASVDVVVGLQLPPLKDDYLPFVIQVTTSLGEKQVVAMVQNTALDMGLILGPYFMILLDEQNPSLDLYLGNGNAGTQTPIVINSITEGETEGGPYLNIELTSTLPTTLNYGEAYHFVITPIGKEAKENVFTTIDVQYEGGTKSYMVEIAEGVLSISELQNDLSLYPNPANTFLLLKGEIHGLVTIFNALGQKMDEFIANGNELTIHTNRYQNGVYFIKAGENTLRFIIAH